MPCFLLFFFSLKVNVVEMSVLNCKKKKFWKNCFHINLTLLESAKHLYRTNSKSYKPESLLEELNHKCSLQGDSMSQ